MDYKEANDIVLIFDLEQTLLKKGLSLDHIAYLKDNNPKSLDEYYSYYDYIPLKDKKDVLVVTKKIIGIDRANNRASFFNNAVGRCKSELNIYRMATAIEHIREDTLKQLHDWYENLYDSVDLIYFIDADVYQVGCDGNHRSLYANIIDAPLIKANVRCYKCNEKKQKTFLYYKKICSDYMVISVCQNFYDNTEVTFLYNTKKYVIEGYDSPIKNGQYCWEQISILAAQLCKDFNYLKKDWLITFFGENSLAKDIFLKCFCKDPKQASRMYQHIYQRKKLDQEE